jgi:hypothetical protein
LLWEKFAVDDDRKMLEEMRQPYRTPSERAEARKARLAEGLETGFRNTMPDRPDEAPAAKVVINVWRVQRQADLTQVAYVRCPSRSGAKIFMNNKMGWPGPFWTEVASQDEVDNAPRLGFQVHDAVFETVPEFAIRMEEEKKQKRREER